MSNDENKLFPIRDLSELTQVNTVTIRAWERRYGLLKPQRTDKGHRLYSLQDVKCVKTILAYIAKGVPVSKVKALLAQDSSEEQDQSSNDWYLLIQQLETVSGAYSLPKIRDFLRDAFLNYPVNLCRKEIIIPVMKKMEASTDNLARTVLLQNAIIDYALMRLNGKSSKKAQKSIVLICAENSPIWKLALSAIELNDANFNVTFINQPCHLRSWLALVDQYPDTPCIVFQEGVWRDNQSKIISQKLAQHSELLLCGTAAMVADINKAQRISSPEKIFEHFCAKPDSEF